MSECTMERFLDDVAKHEMTVLADQGNVRHLSFRAPGTVIQHFNLTTWPNHLCVSGDMGTYVFSRLEDMFDFFRENKINPGYWHEKLKANCTFAGSRQGKNYTFNFVWVLYAIVWGIRKYDEFKAAKPPEEMEFCPDCEGRGKLRNNTFSSEGYRLGFIDCETCGKTGYVKKTTITAELLQALKAVEYSGRYDSIPCCPICREFEPQHKDDCIIGNAITNAEA